MKFAKQERVKSEPYRAFIRTQDCIVPGCSNCPCDAAHIRHGLTGGTGLKPSDEYLHPICREHHREQTDWPLGEADWYMTKLIKPWAQIRYQVWKGK